MFHNPFLEGLMIEDLRRRLRHWYWARQIDQRNARMGWQRSGAEKRFLQNILDGVE